MTTTLDIETLRRLLMEQPEAKNTRAIGLLVSVTFLLAVLHLVRRGRLREEYTPIWIFVAFGIMTLSVWYEGLRAITLAVGAWSPSSTLFFFGEIFLPFQTVDEIVPLFAVFSREFFPPQTILR